MGFTDEQQKTIDLRNSSILVSAAAGSGKTSVLVERIIKRILDEENPCDIDEFLVVTFTKAAAAQMKEKISARLERELITSPENEHLIRQLHLVNRADITTIDSFCLKLVKENFGLLKLDSAFSIADPGFVKLMQNDAMDRLFEDKFSLPEESCERKQFELLLDIFGSVKNDEALRNMLLYIYDTAASFPEIYKWLSNAKCAYECESIEALNELAYVKRIICEIKSKVFDMQENAQRLLDICESEGGPEHYRDAILDDVDKFTCVLKAEGYEGMNTSMSPPWTKLGRAKKNAEFDKQLAEAVKTCRDAYKKSFDSLKIFSKMPDEILEENRHLKGYIVPLLELTEQFVALFDELKKERKLMTFSDVEHMAYKLLCAGYDECGRAVATKAGQSISKRYREIYIDEYQDSNFLQEDILTAVSGYCRKTPNMFMVGDIKQSIYRFRMARPDIFIKKYKSFKDSGNEIKIDLKNNFRSRANVLNFANFMFYQLMGEDLGGVEYVKDIALVPTKSFKEPEEKLLDKIAGSVELHVIESKNEDTENSEGSALSDEELNLDKAALEAKLVAERIRQLTDSENGMYVFDEENEEYRIAKYSDIVILLRNMKNYGETMSEVFTKENIPVYLEENKGYFNAVEIRTIMSLLSVVDNSRDDISLAAVLVSPIGELSDNELAKISLYALEEKLKSGCLLDKCMCYAMSYEDEISAKLKRFFDLVDRLKEMKKNTSIAELIYSALDMTGYYEYASAMPMGKRRRANIDMLLEKAESFENGYYKGLFNFLRYVDKLKLSDIDFGEANILNEGENVVRLTSMHKSKGLEYPIVFVCGLGKNFNDADLKDNIIIHSDYYLAGKLMNVKERYKSNSFMREAFKQLLKSEASGEELRVLYVALTRAKEKLILTGVENGLDKVLEKLGELDFHENTLLPFSVRRDSKSFLRLILAALRRIDTLRDKFDPFEFEMKTYNREDVLLTSAVEEVRQRVNIALIKQNALQKEKDEFYEQYKESFEKEYAYKALVDIKSKMSISDIKKMKAFDGESFDVDEDGEVIKREYTKKEALSGTDYGTLVHKLMELLSFSECLKAEDGVKYIRDFLNRLVSDNIIKAHEAEMINPYKIHAMISSSLGNRMSGAEERGELFREQQFSAGIPVSEIYSEDERLGELSDVVIVQGIIDAFFYEAEELVVIDYKTDRADKSELKSRYKAQLDYYAKTLSGLTGKRIKEKVIYSFYLEEEIIIE